MTSSFSRELVVRRAGAITLLVPRHGCTMPPAKTAGGNRHPARQPAEHNQGEYNAYWGTADARAFSLRAM
jgi:hypothetical protein